MFSIADRPGFAAPWMDSEGSYADPHKTPRQVDDRTEVADVTRLASSLPGGPTACCADKESEFRICPLDQIIVATRLRPTPPPLALLGYLYGIASERRLADAIRLNLAFRNQRILPTIPQRAPWRYKTAMRHKEFVYIPELDRYRCPGGKWLYRQGVTPQGFLRYRTHEYACRGLHHQTAMHPSQALHDQPAGPHGYETVGR